MPRLIQGKKSFVEEQYFKVPLKYVAIEAIYVFKRQDLVSGMMSRHHDSNEPGVCTV